MLILQNQPYFKGAYKKIPVETWDEKYTIKVNGTDCFINKAIVSKVPFNKPWGGTQRSIEQTELNGFINFAADEEVEVAVETKADTTLSLAKM